MCETWFLLQVSMDWALILILQVMLQPSLSGVDTTPSHEHRLLWIDVRSTQWHDFAFFPLELFTVLTEKTHYEAEFGGAVEMGCRFQPKVVNPQDNLQVIWYWIPASQGAGRPREVSRIEKGVEKVTSQSQDYRGRVTFLTEELKEGWAKVKVSTASEMFLSKMNTAVWGEVENSPPKAHPATLHLISSLNPFGKYILRRHPIQTQVPLHRRSVQRSCVSTWHLEQLECRWDVRGRGGGREGEQAGGFGVWFTWSSA